MGSYIKKIRAQLGSAAFIHPAARILIENDRGEFLVIERGDNGRLGLPAGALEEDETIEACIRREVAEEAGLQLGDLTLIGLITDPQREQVTYPNGDQIQYFTVEFYAKVAHVTPMPADEAEVKAARFVPAVALVALPANEQSALESRRYFQETGTVRLG